MNCHLLLLGVFLAVVASNRNWDCLKDAKGRTQRVCLPKGSTPRSGFYLLDNTRSVYRSSKQTESKCSRPKNKTRPKCPKVCADGSLCFQLICRPYGPCTDAGGQVFHVDGKGRPVQNEGIKGLKGTFYSDKRNKCRCFIPRLA
eukprot:GFUD01100287.1.p1 GENE.GFUD01100287.1~~GFUD01100287.1.p1  ORF type:complete len:144 (-),score=18.07 GFUD01100287.1:60-491(-)